MKRVLFVDDNEVVIETYRKVFSRNTDEWQCFFAVDVLDAIDILAYAQIDIIITDLEMPLYNGAQLLNYVQDRYPGVTRIVFSGSQDLRRNMQTVNSAHRFISKPHTIKELEKTIEDIYLLYRKLMDDKTRRIINGIKNLPSLPSVYLDLIEEFTKDTYSLNVIGELISQDIGLTVEILKMVNSSYFGLRESVTSVQQAVTLLGGEIIKGLILTAHISRSFTDQELAFSIEEWEDHSLLTGIFCRTIAEMEGFTKEDQELAFVCGIVHDVGRIILASTFPDKYKKAIDIANSGERSLCDVEKEIMGVNHSTVGAYLLGLWGLPDVIVNAVAAHHHPSKLQSETGKELTTIIHQADLFTYEFVPAFNPGGIEMGEKAYLGEEATSKWDVWRQGCLNKAVEEGYLEQVSTDSNSNFDLTPLEDGAVQSDFIHGYDEDI